MKKNFKESENTEGRLMIVYYAPRLRYSQSDISDEVFDSEFDDNLIFGSYSFDLDRAMDRLIRENEMDLAEYVDENLKGIVDHIDLHWDKNSSNLECDVFFVPGIDPNQYSRAVIDYLNGQMSDGWGEGFEQQEVATKRIYAAFNEDEEWDCYLFANERDAMRRANDENEYEPDDPDEEYEEPSWTWCEVNVSVYASFRKPDEVVVVPEFDEEGYNRSGYDKDGFDRSGKDRDGFDRDGLKPLNNKTPNGRGASFAIGKDGKVRITNTVDMEESRKNAKIRVAEAKVRIAKAELKALKERLLDANECVVEVNLPDIGWKAIGVDEKSNVAGVKGFTKNGRATIFEPESKKIKSRFGKEKVIEKSAEDVAKESDIYKTFKEKGFEVRVISRDESTHL